MKIDLSNIEYTFKNKPLLIGGKAKEYYEIRKSGIDTDFVVSAEDYLNLSQIFPDKKVDLSGDLGIRIFDFEIWKSICWFEYDFLSQNAIEEKEYKIISLDKLLFLTALASREEKYNKDLQLIISKVLELQTKK